MYLYVCVYVCMCVYLCIYMYVCIYMCIYMYVYVYVYIYVFIYMYIHIYFCIRYYFSSLLNSFYLYIYSFFVHLLVYERSTSRKYLIWTSYIVDLIFNRFLFTSWKGFSDGVFYSWLLLACFFCETYLKLWTINKSVIVIIIIIIIIIRQDPFTSG